MKKHLPVVIVSVVFLLGLSVLLYPVISELVNSHNQTRAVAGYNDLVAAISTEDHRAMEQKAKEYNKNLATNQLDYTTSEEAEQTYLSMLRVGSSDVMGYIQIPKIEVRLPLYHTSNETVLQAGVGHLERTSLPIGGENTHAVLTGHRGLPSAKLFTDLDQVKEDDIFTIHVLDLTLTYQVDQILVVEPEEVSSLDITPGQDYVTLVTCTPYGVNTHRLLIRGHRIPNLLESDSTDNIAIPITDNKLPIDPFILVSTAAALFMVILVLILIWRRGKRTAYAEATRVRLYKRFDQKKHMESIHIRLCKKASDICR